MYNLEDNQHRTFSPGVPGRPDPAGPAGLSSSRSIWTSWRSSPRAPGWRWPGARSRGAGLPIRPPGSASGKVEEIAAAAKELAADLLIFDDDLSGSQVKNLEKATELSVMDRSGLILEIFDQRAQSREARTQVELARLKYMLPRLTRQWSHLSRQGGGFGTARRRG